MPPGPGHRQCTPYLCPGPGGMPLVLPLSEGLGRTRDCPEDLRACRGNAAWRVPSRAEPEVTKLLARPRRMTLLSAADSAQGAAGQRTD
jgi:hypothetical protein